MLNWLAGDGGSSHARPQPQAPVTLHVYDLGPSFQGMNMVGRAIGTGVFHAGVEVYGQEWSFCCGQDGEYRTGIFCVPPRGCVAHVYREPIQMGNTHLSEAQVRDLIKKLYREWPGRDYDLLRRNCCHFSAEFCRRLGVGDIPSWITSLAGVGAMLHDGMRFAVKGATDAPWAVANGLWGAGAAVGDLVGGAFQQGLAAPAPAGKMLALDFRPEPRRSATDAGGRPTWNAAAGELVEVWSNTHQKWCPGHIVKVHEDGMVEVTMRLPIASKDNLASKLIPLGHEHLRKAQPADNSNMRASSGEPLSKGDPVEVWSNSAQSWCQGYVAKVEGGMLFLEFQLPGSNAGEMSSKQLPVGHKDVCRALGAARSSSSGAGAGANSAAAKARAAASKALATALKSDDRAAIERACNEAEAAGVSAQEVEAGRTKALRIERMEEVRDAKKSNDSKWIDMACRRAADAGVPASELKEARDEARKIFCRENLKIVATCADAELLEEACQQAKAAGVTPDEIDAIRIEAEALIAERELAKHRYSNGVPASVPEEDMLDPLTTKVAQYSPGAEADGAAGPQRRIMPAPFDTVGSVRYAEAPRPPQTMVVMPRVGDWVEVYSNSHKAWCPGRITKVSDEGPTVVFQLPGGKTEEWFEKLVLTGNAASILRRPAPANPAPTVPGTCLLAAAQNGGTAWSAEESAAYSRAFRQLAGDAAFIEQGIAAEFLRGSGLPRKTLKQIWMVAVQKERVERLEFFACLRLIGHCQGLLASGDILAADILADGGEGLRQMLTMEFLPREPTTVARFHGQALEM